MKHLIMGIVFLSISTAYSQDIGNYPDGYIPKNITDALRYLNTTWADEDKEEFRVQDEDDALAELHFGVGMSIRNSWGFWSKKKNSLVKKIGVLWLFSSRRQILGYIVAVPQTVE